MRAVSLQEPGRLVRILTGGILGCGGWVLGRGASDTGRVNLLFEFERQACIDIYTVLIASGIELSQNGHIRFTELCQCTRMSPEERSCEIASVDLEVLTYTFDAPKSSLVLANQSLCRSVHRPLGEPIAVCPMCGSGTGFPLSTQAV